jgi:hypothetical protein
MSSGSTRTEPSPRLNCGLKKKLSIGQQSWTKGRRKASQLNEDCRARGMTNETRSLTKVGARIVSRPPLLSSLPALPDRTALALH